MRKQLRNSNCWFVVENDTYQITFYFDFANNIDELTHNQKLQH